MKPDLIVLLMLLYHFTIICAGSNYHIDFVPLPEENSNKEFNAKNSWWQRATFYQIYPRSFKDSDGDGIGDIKGIIENLPYLRDIGITAAWLSPIFTSPMADFGYDIANYTEIDPIFGTMSDFEDLIAKANKFNIKIILDFVPNHTSDESTWFKLSAAGDPMYKDFYVWHAGKIVDGERQPPTNWVSVFHGSAWEWHEQRQAYYLHQFLKKQPDLNYRNPKVREMMNDVLRFWLQKGVYGFRIDAVPHIFEISTDADGNWPDEPRNNDVPDPTDYDSLKHVYTVDQPETIEQIYLWRRVLDDFQDDNGGDERVLILEANSPIDIVMKYYGNDTMEGAQIPFNFLLINELTKDSNAHQYTELIDKWIHNMPEIRTANWVIGNHDQHRVATRLGEERIDLINMLLMSLPGVSFTYYGEEIGMTDVWISWNDTVDPSACNTNPSIYEKFSRDPERTPFQWSNETNAGFSSASKTWLPIAENYKRVNVMRESKTAFSHLDIYKQMHSLRGEPAMDRGGIVAIAVSDNLLAIARTLKGSFSYVTLLNLNNAVASVNLLKFFDFNPYLNFEYVVVNDKSKAQKGDKVAPSFIRLMPYEGAVVRPVLPGYSESYYGYN